ncbi:MAG: DUF1269 domain-containing protein [Arthrobacter sp.]
MAKTHDVFIYVGTYPSEAAANEDMKLLRDLKGEGSYDTAVIRQDDKGKVHVKKRESAVSHGFMGGMAAGGALAVIFPVGFIAGATIGDVSGAVIGHFRRGLKRSDVKELADIIDPGQAAILVVGERKVEPLLKRTNLQPTKHVTKDVDVSSKDIKNAIEEAGEEVS